MNHTDRIDKFRETAKKAAISVNALTIIGMIVTFVSKPNPLLNRLTAALASFAGILNIMMLVVLDSLGFDEEGKFSVSETRKNIKKRARQKVGDTVNIADIRSQLPLEGVAAGNDLQDATNDDWVEEETAACIEEEQEELMPEEVSSEKEEAAEAVSTEQPSINPDPVHALVNTLESLCIIERKTGSYRILDPKSLECIHEGEDFYKDISASIEENVAEEDLEKVRKIYERESLEKMALNAQTASYSQKIHPGEDAGRLYLMQVGGDEDSIAVGLCPVFDEK